AAKLRRRRRTERRGDPPHAAGARSFVDRRADQSGRLFQGRHSHRALHPPRVDRSGIPPDRASLKFLRQRLRPCRAKALFFSLSEASAKPSGGGGAPAASEKSRLVHQVRQSGLTSFTSSLLYR